MIVRLFLIVFGVVSVVLLGAAAYYGFFAGAEAPPQAEAPQAPAPPPPMVAAAAHAIPTGSLIQHQDLRFVAVTPGQDTAGDFMRNNVAPAEQPAADKAIMDQIVGAVSRHRFNENDPILRNEVVKPGDSGFLAAVLQPGKRATTIGVTAVTGAAGLVYPGDHVDVVLTQVFAGKENDPGNRSVAETIAADVRVIAVDQQLQANAAPNKEGKIASTVTLEADPLQVQTLEVAAKMGELSLAIRGVPHEGDVAAANAEAANGTPSPVWAHDVSPAAARNTPRGVAPPPPANGDKNAPPSPPGDGKPAVRVMRGEKAENVALP